MIFDQIKNMENYKDFPRIYKSLRFLNSLLPDQLMSDALHINGDNIFANPCVLTSKPVKDYVYEGHKKYIDIYFIISCMEGNSTADSKSLKIIKDYQDDILYFDGSSATDTTCWLTPVCFLWYASQMMPIG